MLCLASSSDQGILHVPDADSYSRNSHISRTILLKMSGKGVGSRFGSAVGRVNCVVGICLELVKRIGTVTLERGI